MIVLCNGMHRSGSTWSFSVCVKLLRLADPRANVSAQFTKTPGDLINALEPRYDHLVIKAHSLDYPSMALSCCGAAKVVYTHRDAYDAVASLMQMFQYPFDDALAAIHGSLLLYEFHHSHGRAMIVPYASLMEKPLETIGAISRYLELDASAAMIVQVNAETSFQAMKAMADQIGDGDSDFLVRRAGDMYDTRTHLHRHHLRNGASGYGRGMLSRRQQQCVGKMLRELAGRAVDI